MRSTVWEGPVMKVEGMKEFTLLALSKNLLRKEDKCAVMRVASGCSDSLEATRAIYELAGR